MNSGIYSYVRFVKNQKDMNSGIYSYVRFVKYREGFR